MTDESKPPIWPTAKPQMPSADTPTSPHADTEATSSEAMTAAEVAAECVAFEELLAFIKQHKDTATEVTHASAEEFANNLE